MARRESVLGVDRCRQCGEHAVELLLLIGKQHRVLDGDRDHARHRLECRQIVRREPASAPVDRLHYTERLA